MEYGGVSGTRQIIAISVFMFLATIFVLLRLVIRRLVLGTFGVGMKAQPRLCLDLY